MPVFCEQYHKEDFNNLYHKFVGTNIVLMLPKLLMFIPVLLFISLLCFAMSAPPSTRPVSTQVMAGISLKEVARLEMVFTHD